MTEYYYFIVYIYHIFLIHSSVNGHLGCFHVLAIVNSAAMNRQNNAICSNMDGTRDSYTKWSRSERERQIPYDITYAWNLKYGTNENFHRKETHGLAEQTCGCQGRGWRSGMDWESGVNRCKLLPLEWISNEILLYSTGNHI